MERSNQKLELSVLIKVSMLAVISLLLMQIELSLSFLFPEFLKIDLSDIPALFGGFALGPIAGVLILLLKNLLHGILMTKTAFIGEVANFSVGVFLIYISSHIYIKNRSKKGAILGLLTGTIVMALVAGIMNYYIFMPAYANLYGVSVDSFVKMASKVNGNVNSFKSLIYWSIIPFNLLKGFIVSLVSMGLYKSLAPVILNNKHKNKLNIDNK
ncbi:ECF transporter S component [Hathewaya histolytica]|uniref:Riboflavin transporter n=1 Tax=Hathewaya histolytica TaxID=1498 RepID=A0A4U9RQS3_HATHI|nr:ECF transporter S component [Hathewaya histolytica]VTQ94028.1 riboflavin transporter [Hathewaya histolytica]